MGVQVVSEKQYNQLNWTEMQLFFGRNENHMETNQTPAVKIRATKLGQFCQKLKGWQQLCWFKQGNYLIFISFGFNYFT